MFRRFAVALNAVAPAAAPQAKSKMQVLHKILTGEMQFKNKTPLKVSYVTQVFGKNWQSEINAYAAKLPAAEKTVLDRQVARLALTAYTTRELGKYLANGVENLEATAWQGQVADAKAFAEVKGIDELTKLVKAEGALVGWSTEQMDKLIAAAKAK